jgi:hypothetical protein
LEVKGERILIQETYGLDWYNMKFWRYTCILK